MPKETGGGGYGTVATSIAGIQNGSPDGIALVDAGGVVIQFLSYEGAFIANDGPAVGMMSIDIIVSQPSTNPLMLSLQLMGTGSTYNDFTWSNPSAETPNLINNGQTFQGTANVVLTFAETSVAGTCSGESTITRTWTATSVCNIVSTHVQTITVVDTSMPMPTCQDVTIVLDENGIATITPEQINNGSTDNCGAVTLSLSQTDFTCANAGANIVTLTVTDDCGNIGTCTSTVTVVDNTAPVITCPQDIFVNLDPGACDAIVTWNDATATDNCGIASIVQTAGPASGTTLGRGTTNTVTYVATDTGGNTSTCSFNIQVIEFVPSSNDIACNSLVHILSLIHI